MDARTTGSKYEAPQAVRLSNAQGAAAAYCAAGQSPSTDYCEAGGSAPAYCTAGTSPGTACTQGETAHAACTGGTAFGF
jgi:hypothetical protein